MAFIGVAFTLWKNIVFLCGVLGGRTIEDMLKWKGNYVELERNHRYIQWLFPIRERSNYNGRAQPLQDNEAQAIRNDPELRERVLRAYQMMLDFYGMRLHSKETGEIRRSENCRERFKHLNNSTHNYLRITRILKAIGEFGYEKYQVPWLTFILQEALVHKTLPNLDGGCVGHWINALSNDTDRQAIIDTYAGLGGGRIDNRRAADRFNEHDY